MPEHILIVDDEALNLTIVSKFMTREGYHVTVFDNAPEAIAFLETTHIDLIILDVMMPGMDGFEACQVIRDTEATSQIPILLLTALSNVEHRIKGFEAGADVFLSKPFEPQELAARSKVLLRRAAIEDEAERRINFGKVISCYSLKGGVGVSTLAANLAVGLAQLWNEKTALVDMVFHGGQAGLMLNIPGRSSWQDISMTSADELDSEMLEMVMRPHESGVYVLTAPPTLTQGVQTSVETVHAMLKVLRKEFEYIILDLPNDFTETTVASLKVSDMILNVFAPEIASVRSMRMLLNSYREMGIPEEHIHLILNWTFTKYGISSNDIEDALRRKVEWVIPYTPEKVIPGINLGKPPVCTDPESAFGRTIEDLAYVVSKEEHKKKQVSEPSSSWVRLAKRVRRKGRK